MALSSFARAAVEEAALAYFDGLSCMLLAAPVIAAGQAGAEPFTGFLA